jgi:DNA/RNA-binding domain of Phe-tRNA-synthetase-like protein
VQIENSNNPLIERILTEACDNAKKKFHSLSDISADPIVKGMMRKLFSTYGLDATKERPSGEALIRRIVDGKGLYRINSFVDLNNAISISSGCPCGVYDISKIKGDIEFIIGTTGQTYEGILGNQLNAETTTTHQG